MKNKNRTESELFKLKSDFNLNSVLTKREIEVLRYVVLGLNNEEIGKELYISNNTIKIHIKNIMYKLREVPDINIKIKNCFQHWIDSETSSEWQVEGSKITLK